MTSSAIIRSLAAAIAAASLIPALSSCGVDEKDRYVELPPVEVKRAVLVEDFTGQRCTNCPMAHLMIEGLEEQYGDAFIPVSIHSGTQSLPITNTRLGGLATEQGEAYDAAAGVASHGYPSMIVNYDKSNIYQGTANQWIEAVRAALATPAVVDIDVEATHETAPDGRSTISITTRMNPSVPLTAKLQLWIIENGIVAAQMGSDWSGYDRQYVHNNVFRAAANGLWGQDVTLPAYTTTESTCTYTISGAWEQSWKIPNLRIVAFLYTEADGVLQAARCPVTEAAAE